MANELADSINLTATKGSYSVNFTQTASFTQNTQGAASGIAATTTTKSNIDVGSVVTLGFLVLMNLDSTNNCDAGVDNAGTFIAFATLKPGEWIKIRCKAGSTYQLKAAAGTPNIQYWLLND